MNKWFKNYKIPSQNVKSPRPHSTIEPAHALSTSEDKSQEKSNKSYHTFMFRKKEESNYRELVKSIEDLQTALAQSLEVSVMKEKVIRSLKEELEQKNDIIKSLHRKLDEARTTIESNDVETRKKIGPQVKNLCRNTFPVEMLTASDFALDERTDIKLLRATAPVTTVELGRVHRTAISAEPFDNSVSLSIPPPVAKAKESKELIEHAVLDNDFLKNLESGQVKEIVDSMYSEEYKVGEVIIQEGDAGKLLYAIEGKTVTFVKRILKNNKCVTK